MTDAPDAELLAEFACTDSQTAFATLVERHIGLVHSVALRHTTQPQHAQDITQAVFIILAKKAATLNRKTILPGWLYNTTRLTAANFQRTEARRIRREQKAFMRSTLEETATDRVWSELSPLLDEAMARLGATDRDALVLRYFQNKTLPEVGAALGLEERAAQKRVMRAVEKLRKIFIKRGVTLMATAIAGAVSTNSVEAAPVGLAKTISAVAVAKGAAATTSTLTLVKGALKLMAWSKMQTAIITGAVVLLAVGTTTVTVKEFHEHHRYPWEMPTVSFDLIHKTPPQVVIVPTIYDRGSLTADYTKGGGAIGICQSITNILRVAYPGDTYRLIVSPGLSNGRYDFFAKVSPDEWGILWRKALQKELETKLGVIGKLEIRNADVLLLKYVNPNAGGLQPPDSLRHRMNLPPNIRGMSGTNSFANFLSPISALKDSLQAALQIPVVDETGLNGLYDFKYTWDNFDQTKMKENIRQAVLDQLGFELVPTNMPVEMLVVEKTN